MFWIGFLIMLAGAVMDIVSSLGFEKFRSSTNYLKEGNKSFGGIWVNKKTGGYNEKLGIGALLIVAAIMLIMHFTLPPDFDLGLFMFGMAAGVIRGWIAMGNWKAKEKTKERMAQDRVREAEEKKLADAQAFQAAQANGLEPLPLDGQADQQPRGFTGGAGGSW